MIPHNLRHELYKALEAIGPNPRRVAKLRREMTTLLKHYEQALAEDYKEAG